MELLSEHSVLFAEVIDSVALLLSQPSGDRTQQHSKRVEGATQGPMSPSNIIQPDG
jgi:hypothetical protein